MGEMVPNGSPDAVAGSNVNSSQVNGHDLGDQHPLPPAVPFLSFAALKDRIRHHYEICSDYYYSLWGEHIHHGYFVSPSDTKEVAQRRLIQLLLEKSQLADGTEVLDVGCGIGGTGRFLAQEKGCHVMGITISGKQVEIAGRLSREEAAKRENEEAQASGNLSNDGVTNGVSDSAIRLRSGSVKFLELDAEKMGEHFGSEEFDCVWISEAMSHLPNKELFFRNTARVLRKGGKLVVADWFKRAGCSEEEMEADIKVIEGTCLRSGFLFSTKFENR
jgi:tocopherol O-methyltransferase